MKKITFEVPVIVTVEVEVEIDDTDPGAPIEVIRAARVRGTDSEGAPWIGSTRPDVYDTSDETWYESQVASDAAYEEVEKLLPKDPKAEAR